MYLRPPSASEEARINDWIKVRQSGIRYYLSLGDQRIVDKNFIIRPKAEFEVRSIFIGFDHSIDIVINKATDHLDIHWVGSSSLCVLFYMYSTCLTYGSYEAFWSAMSK